MPELLEAPAETQPNLSPEFIAHIIDTPEKASAAGKRSGEARRERAMAKQVNGTNPIEPDAVQVALNGQLKLVAEQIAHTRELLNDDDYGYCEHCKRSGIEPHHRAQLLKALDALALWQRKLLGIADPGPRKPAPEPRQPRRTEALPMPTPAPTQDKPGC